MHLNVASGANRSKKDRNWIPWVVQRALKESRKTIARLLKFHKRAAQICVFPRAFLTLRVTQLVLKIVHLTISMEPRGPRAWGLLLR